MISVIIPTYRRYEMLQEAVRSVLAQTYKDVEIIVVDDCSGDGTEHITKLFPNIIYLCNKSNSGPGHSRRRGLMQSRGEYVVFLDDDDYYTDPSFYSKAVAILEATPNCVFVSANATVFHEYDGTNHEARLNVVGPMTTADYLKGFPFLHNKPHSTFTSIFRKSALQESGAADMAMLNDMPLYMRSLTVCGSVYFMEDTIGVYRVHDANISKAMTWDFICANLEEKYLVKQSAVDKNLFSNVEDWWLKQMEITVSYFVYGSHPSLRELRKSKRWCLNHSENKEQVETLFKKYKDYLIDDRICKLKCTIKQILHLK